MKSYDILISMKIKSLITLSLLFVLSFSIVHEYVFNVYDNEHSSTLEYIQELETPSNHGDICDIHYEYHQAYIFTQNSIYLDIVDKKQNLILEKNLYDFSTSLTLVRPPIA